MKKRGNRHGQKDGRRAAEKERLPHRMNVAVPREILLLLILILILPLI